MTAFPKYPRYKDSGVEWLGDVPDHWEVRRNLGIFDERKEANLPNAELLSVTQDRGIIRQSEITAKKDSSNDDKTKYKVVKVGDLAYNKMRAWQGALGISDYDGIVSPAYVVLTPRNPKLSKFFHYLFRTNEFITEANRLSYGLCGDMNSLRYEHFKTSYSVIPPDRDIDRIVTFLDEKTTQIDALIAKKQRQIELLDEQKAILINRAVTRGLHPNPDLQDSGIPWIGPIPKHWHVIPIKRMASVQNGVTLGPVYPVNISSEVPYLRVANVQNGSLNLNVVATLRLPRRVAAKYLLQSGDVLVAEGGDLDKLGRGCVWRAELPYCIHQNHVFAVRTEAKRLLPDFLSTALGSRYGQRYFMLTGKQTTNLASTNSTSLMNFPLPTPPVEEQVRIMEELARTQKAFERARNAITSQIQTLQTLRSTLIAHAVTGKIRV